MLFSPLLARKTFVLCTGVLLGAFHNATFGHEPLPLRALTELGLEELLQVEVTSVSKKAAPWFGASAAIHVITQDDLRRSGARTVADALRMVPGINVAQIDASKWAVSARGFNGLYAHDLLVLMDGRSVYSPLHSGVLWDTVDTFFDDIERIEVIRGPGATLWGANAVNGVINIITKQAQATQGKRVSAAFGNQEGVIGARHGGPAGDAGHYRIYAKYANFDNNEHKRDSSGEPADDWRTARTGFRGDWQLSSADQLTVQGDYYEGVLGETLSYPDLSVPFSFRTTEARDMEVSGANVLARWTRQLHDNSDFMLQLYYDRTERIEDPFEETHDTLDFEIQHNHQLTARQQLIAGAGYRHTKDHTQASFRYGFADDERNIDQFNLFIQDEIAVADSLSATAGIKFEHFEYTGWETQPNLRVAWTPTSADTLWAAVSRAVRTPSRNDDDVVINVTAFPGANGTPTVVRILGNSEVQSETGTAYELGYRMRPSPDLYTDIALFYNEYDDLLGTESLTPFIENEPAPAHLVIPRRFVNDTVGRTQGVELATTWHPTPATRFYFSYAYLDMDVTAPDGFDITGNSPANQAHARWSMDLSTRVEFDTAVYYVDELNVQNRTQPVNDYTRVDFRMGWQVNRWLNVAGGIRNAFDPQHPEFGSIPFIQASELDRTYYADLVANF